MYTQVVLPVVGNVEGEQQLTGNAVDFILPHAFEGRLYGSEGYVVILDCSTHARSHIAHSSG